MTKEVMIKAIYEKIADKTLSFGCIVENNYGEKFWINRRSRNGLYIIGKVKLYDNIKWFGTPACIDLEGKFHKPTVYKTIGHPVIIGDVLEYYFIEGKLGTFQIYNPTLLELLELWEYKRKPIEEQSEECIEYVYNLIK